MNRTARLLLIVGLGAWITGCSTEAEFDAAALREVIQAKNNAFTKAHVTGEIEIINDYFTADARVFPPNDEVMTGKAVIAALNAEWIEYGISEFREETTALYGTEDLLVEEGLYFLTYGEANAVDEGKYINIWKQVDGDWKVQSNIWNTSVPFDQ